MEDGWSNPAITIMVFIGFQIGTGIILSIIVTIIIGLLIIEAIHKVKGG